MYACAILTPGPNIWLGTIASCLTSFGTSETDGARGGAAAQDPVNCALTALQLTELDAASFEATYQLVVEASKSGTFGPNHIFSAARHLDGRGYPHWAFPLTIHAIRLFSLGGLQENHPLAHDVLWSCLLAHRIGPVALQEILTHVIRNVHCPTLLADILHRCRAPPSPLPHHRGDACHTAHRHPHQLIAEYHPPRCPTDTYVACYASAKQSQSLLPVDAPPLKALLEATINAFVGSRHLWTAQTGWTVPVSSARQLSVSLVPREKETGRSAERTLPQLIFAIFLPQQLKIAITNSRMYIVSTSLSRILLYVSRAGVANKTCNALLPFFYSSPISVRVFPSLLLSNFLHFNFSSNEIPALMWVN
uniref:ZSWIM4-8 C-terminal domain-containing protein n=1 Tax=Mesocestoides corti TaxID=53468 RepID=A0A5K3EIA9_MESCO